MADSPQRNIPSPTLDMANHVLRMFAAPPLPESIRQDEAVIAQGHRERREARAVRLAGTEVSKAIDSMSRLGRPITPALGYGLAEIAIATYRDALALARR